MSTWRRSILAAVKHLILDVNVIVDLWLQENSVDETEAIFIGAQSGHVRLWISASALTTLAYVARRAFKTRGVPPQAVAELIPKLVEHLLLHVNVLTNHGFEQLEIYRLATDFEDAQIVAAICALAGENVCIVTEDEGFDALGEVPCKKPAEAVAWLYEQNPPSNAKPMLFIDLAAQQVAIRPQLERNMETVLRHGQYIMGTEVKELEEKLANYTGSKHCITVASGTEALLISLMALGVKPDDEIITTPFTFVATAEVIVLLGAKPVFVDIEQDTCNIDARLIDAAVTPKTKAIMPVSLYGQPADMDEINTIAAKYNLPVIEDAAQSFGATYKGKKSCNLFTIGCTSFFPSKPLGCYGDGGAIFTNDDTIAQACREIRVHGQSRRYYHSRVGVGRRVDTLQCAIVLAKLERFDWEVEQRLKIGQHYNELLDAQGIQRVIQRPDRTSVFAQYTVFVDDREALQVKVPEAGIPTAVHYPLPLSQQRAYQHLCCAGCTPNALEAAYKVMSLPMGADLGIKEQLFIAKTLAAYLVK